jgi:hypothetical protein
MRSSKSVRPNGRAPGWNFALLSSVSMSVHLASIWRVFLLTALVSLLTAQTAPLADLGSEESLRGIEFVPGSLNGAEAISVLVDTGTGESGANGALADRLKLPMVRGTASVSGDSALQVRVIPQAMIALGTAEIKGRLAALPLADLESIFGRRIDAIAGGDLLRQSAAEFDFARRRIRLHAGAAFRYGGNGASLPIELLHNVPYVELTVLLPNGKRVQGKFTVDTGAGGVAIQIFTPLAEREGWLAGLGTISETGHGIGGTTHHLAARAAALDAGPYRLVRPTIAFTEDYDEAHTPPGVAGLVGVELLRRFRVILDYPDQHIYLEPNTRLDEPFVYDATGLRLRASAPRFNTFTVSQVIERSAAAGAGIEPGDKLLAIDGTPVEQLDLEGVRMRLHEPGKSHRLKLSRKGRILDLKLQTRDLLP